MASIKTDLNQITNLCCIVNAFDTGCTDNPKYIRQTTQQRNLMLEIIRQKASDLYFKGICLNRISKAMHRAGWDDNNYFMFDMKKNQVIIRYKD